MFRCPKTLVRFEGLFVIPKGSDPYLGKYLIVMDYAGKSYSSEFAVDAYKKTDISCQSNRTEKKPISVLKKSTLRFSARYYLRKSCFQRECQIQSFSVKRNSITLRLALFLFSADAAEYLGLDNVGTSDLVLQGDGKLDGKGTFDFSFEPSKIDTDYTYSVFADVTTADSTISGATAVSVNRSAFFIRATKELSVYSPGDTLSLGGKTCRV